jgi:hypothetical protein
MKTITLVSALVAIFAFQATVPPVMAQETCKSQAVGKDGEPLAGAALKSFMTKCTREACGPKAIDKNGKPLAGAAKDSFMKKCQSSA